MHINKAVLLGTSLLGCLFAGQIILAVLVNGGNEEMNKSKQTTILIGIHILFIN